MRLPGIQDNTEMMRKKYILFTDLDNTLIHSYKHKREGDLCVEYIDGREQSYLSPHTYRALSELWEKIVNDVISSTIEIIPVTSRSLEQYRRIMWPDGRQPHYAVTTNGGILLVDGEPEETWMRESLERIAPYREELFCMQRLFTEENNHVRIRMVDDMYLFVCSNDGEDLPECGAECVGRTELNVITTGRKRYLFPPGLDKGMAAERIKKRQNADIVFCAGDSEPDLPMLCRADVAFVPDRNMAGKLPAHVKCMVRREEKLFSDFIVDEIQKMIF